MKSWSAELSGLLFIKRAIVIMGSSTFNSTLVKKYKELAYNLVIISGEYSF